MKKLFAIILMLISFTSFTEAYETDTHERLNGYISESTINNFSFDLYLKDKLEQFSK